MKKTTYLLIVIIFILTSCYKSTYCDAFADSISGVDTTNKMKIGLKWNIAFNPLFLPVKIIFNPKEGFSVVHTGEQNIITPLGNVSLNYNIGVDGNQQINGYNVKDGDYLVAIVDKKKGKKEVFKIEGYSSLSIIAEGKTQMEFKKGYAEIDITNSKINDLKFVDRSKISFVNFTNKMKGVSFIVSDNVFGEQTFNCQVEANSYKIFPSNEMKQTVGQFFQPYSKFYVKVTDYEYGTENEKSIKYETNLGDIWNISNNQKDNFKLEKSNK